MLTRVTGETGMKIGFWKLIMNSRDMKCKELCLTYVVSQTSLEIFP
jgi:hypothetical protein